MATYQSVRGLTDAADAVSGRACARGGAALRRALGRRVARPVAGARARVARLVLQQHNRG